MAHDPWNEAMVSLMLKHKMVDREQLRGGLGDISADRDIGLVMVMRGHLSQANYEKMRQFLQQQIPKRDNAKPAAAQAPIAVPVAAQAPTATASSGENHKTPKEAVETADQSTLPSEFRVISGGGQLQQAIPERLSGNEDLDTMLLFARKHSASDLHLAPNQPVHLRRFGQLVSVTPGPMAPENIRRILQPVMQGEAWDLFRKTGDLELAYSIPGGGRYRLTVMEQRFGWDFSVRVVPNKIRNLEEIGLPESCVDLTKWAQGMVLITGPMGSGKTSTLTSLVEMINHDRHDHIITIEDPIEVIYKQAKCQITQRQVGLHTLSEHNALKGALRQDPDILVISELRDLKTIRLAISAAETGHLVLGTMNTANAARTLERLVDAFPPDERDNVRNMISESIRGIISQQLIPRKDGNGMVAAFEVMITTGAIANMIRKNTIGQLETAILSGRQRGMCLMDESLRDLLNKDLIEGQEVYFRASHPKNFAKHAPAGFFGANYA